MATGQLQVLFLVSYDVVLELLSEMGCCVEKRVES